MRIASTFIGRMIILAVFLAISLAMFLYMYQETGAIIPLLNPTPKKLVFYTENMDNLVKGSQVQIAGVRVGQVLESEATARGGKVTFQVYDQHWPTHQGLKIRIGQRSLVGESYLELRDGHGPPIPDGTTLSRDTIIPVVNLYDVYAAFDSKTRATTGEMLRSLGESTKQTRDQLSATMDGLALLGQGGHDAIDAIASQNVDLRKLAAQTTTLLQALDTGEGQIADLVTSANKVTQATASQKQSFDETMRVLPVTFDAVHDASGSLVNLAHSLAPVASDLRRADTKLSEALVQLPELTHNLRALMPPAYTVLNRAPKTLDRVPEFSDDVNDVIEPARNVLQDVNPVLGYLRPYGPDIAAFFANFSAAAEQHDEAGRYNIRALLTFDEKLVATPVGLPVSAAVYSNPFPKPGVGVRPGPFKGPYPHVEREPK